MLLAGVLICAGPALTRPTLQLSARLTAIVLSAELAAGLGCFWVARERIVAVKNAEGWSEGLRQAVAADTGWLPATRTCPAASQWDSPRPVLRTAGPASRPGARFPRLPASYGLLPCGLGCC